MSGYVPDANDATKPTDANIAETAAAEFRALKAKVNTISSGALQGSGLQNILLNGDFQLNQINGSNFVSRPTAGGPEYFSDMWNTGSGAMGLNILGMATVVETTPGFSPPPNYNTYQSCQVLTSIGTLAPNAFFEICQYVEGTNMRHMGFGTGAARASTILFYARTTVAGQVMAGTLRNAANNRSYVFSFTTGAVNVWTRYAISVPGDTVGGTTAWPGGPVESAQITFTLASDTVYKAIPGAWRAGNFIGTTTPNNVNFFANPAGSIFEFTGVEWRPGTYSVGNPVEIIPYQLMFSLVARYYFQDNMFLLGSNAVTSVSLPAIMRKLPVFSSSLPAAVLLGESLFSAQVQNTGPNSGALVKFDARLEVT